MIGRTQIFCLLLLTLFSETALAYGGGYQGRRSQGGTRRAGYAQNGNGMSSRNHRASTYQRSSANRRASTSRRSQMHGHQTTQRWNNVASSPSTSSSPSSSPHKPHTCQRGCGHHSHRCHRCHRCHHRDDSKAAIPNQIPAHLTCVIKAINQEYQRQVLLSEELAVAQEAKIKAADEKKAQKAAQKVAKKAANVVKAVKETGHGLFGAVKNAYKNQQKIQEEENTEIQSEDSQNPKSDPQASSRIVHDAQHTQPDSSTTPVTVIQTPVNSRERTITHPQDGAKRMLQVENLGNLAKLEKQKGSSDDLILDLKSKSDDINKKNIEKEVIKSEDQDDTQPSKFVLVSFDPQGKVLKANFGSIVKQIILNTATNSEIDGQTTNLLANWDKQGQTMDENERALIQLPLKVETLTSTLPQEEVVDFRMLFRGGSSNGGSSNNEYSRGGYSRSGSSNNEYSRGGYSRSGSSNSGYSRGGYSRSGSSRGNYQGRYSGGSKYVSEEIRKKQMLSAESNQKFVQTFKGQVPDPQFVQKQLLEALHTSEKYQNNPLLKATDPTFFKNYILMLAKYDFLETELKQKIDECKLPNSDKALQACEQKLGQGKCVRFNHFSARQGCKQGFHPFSAFQCFRDCPAGFKDFNGFLCMSETTKRLAIYSDIEECAAKHGTEEDCVSYFDELNIEVFSGKCPTGKLQFDNICYDQCPQGMQDRGFGLCGWIDEKSSQNVYKLDSEVFLYRLDNLL